MVICWRAANSKVGIMITRIIYFGFLLSVCFSSVSCAQSVKYKSFSGSFNTYAIAMDLKGAASTPSYDVYYGFGGAYGSSLKENMNIRAGADFFYFKPKNVRGYYDFCFNDTEDGSCLPVVSTVQLQIPVEIEFYLNSDYARYKVFFSAGLMPVVSFTEQGEMIEFDAFLNEQARYEIKNNGLKIQALYFLSSVTTEFFLFGNYKFFIEPSIRFSSSFKREDYSNPIHYFLLKSGFRARIEK